ncbi:phosphatase PAP2 family protein [Aliterella atlantica]|uniref:Phospholipid phosphatase n=1 Tax=Aliterella atlantica CENA595 TaxID=1618023 RepID=A0A0D9A284_9CYAN|nr:phosphatase PAP2 family protein [Aliterella atlantica]KJH73586.1 phospholipid phosphatase [Aliterella atlantica CENA595]
MPWVKNLVAVFTVLCCTTIATKVRADSFDQDVSRVISNEGTIIYLGTGVALPLLLDSKNGKNQSLRALDSLGTSLIVCQGLKAVIDVKRPDSDDRDSFPSCHATLAFTIATMQSEYQPKYALLWYAGASAIAYSRVNLNRHRWTEVLAGAAIGYGIAKLELSQPNGLILFPLIGSDDEGGTVVGLQMSKSF